MGRKYSRLRPRILAGLECPSKYRNDFRGTNFSPFQICCTGSRVGLFRIPPVGAVRAAVPKNFPTYVRYKNEILFPLKKALTKIELIIRLRGTTNIFRPEFLKPGANG